MRAYSAVIDRRAPFVYRVRLGHRRINWDELHWWIVIGTEHMASASARRAIRRRERWESRKTWQVES